MTSITGACATCRNLQSDANSERSENGEVVKDNESQSVQSP